MKCSILGEIYEISFEDLKNLGECDALTCTIKLNSELKQNKEQLWRVLRHELGHAFAYQSGLSDYMNNREQEMFAQTMGNFLLIFDEPEWLELLINQH